VGRDDLHDLEAVRTGSAAESDESNRANPEVAMNEERDISPWIASVERGDLGYTYVRLYADAPAWVRYEVVNRFGKGTVFLRPQRTKPLAA
jgi:hypothetical protein